jgi:hypothetical protein
LTSFCTTGNVPRKAAQTKRGITGSVDHVGVGLGCQQDTDDRFVVFAHRQYQQGISLFVDNVGVQPHLDDLGNLGSVTPDDGFQHIFVGARMGWHGSKERNDRGKS